MRMLGHDMIINGRKKYYNHIEPQSQFSIKHLSARHIWSICFDTFFISKTARDSQLDSG